jgi:hypothetical protein
VSFRCHGLAAALFVLGATVASLAQEIVLQAPSGDRTEGFLPPPLEALQPPRAEDMQRAASAPGVERLPPPAIVEQLPLPNFAPNAITPFSPQERRVELIRRNEVVTISNSALRNSGVFEMALRNSPALAQSFYDLQAHTLRLQQLQFQLKKGAPNEAAAKALSDARDVVRADQIRAQAQFEEDLWHYGFNGAKVGTVASLNRAVPSEPDHFVMIKAIADSPSNNLGYSKTQVYPTGELGMTTVPSEYLMPFPVEANDLFYEKDAASYTQRAPDGVMIPLSANPAINPVFQILAAPQGLLYYDTGFVTPSANIAVGASLDSQDDHRAGQTFLSNAAGSTQDFINFDLAMNAQLLDIGWGNSLQFFTVANNDLDSRQFGISSLGVRAYNRELGSVFEGWSLVVGQKQSIFGETSATPAGLTSGRTLIGTVNRLKNVGQFGVVAPLSNLLTWKIALEDPVHDQPDVFYPAAGAGITKLNRWPTLASNLSLENKAENWLVQLGGLIRSNGFESNATGDESFDTGWGLSAIAEFRQNNSMNFLGVAGGTGVGSYIQGIQYAAAADSAAGTLDGLSAVGAFVGRQTWSYDETNNPIAVCNVAYGYSLMEDPQIIGLDPNRKLHQAWINYTRFIGDRVGIGVEYQYGFRQVASGNVGEDHRFLLVVSVRSSPTRQSTQVQTSVASPSFADELPSPGATVSGRAIEDVVSQYQRGGSAFQQGL